MDTHLPPLVFGSQLRPSSTATRAILTTGRTFILKTAAIDRLLLPPCNARQMSNKSPPGILGAVDRKIDPHQRRHAALEALFKALLRELTVGEIRVKELHSSALAVN